MENFIKGRGWSRQIHKKKITEKLASFMENGGGLTQSIKSLTEKVKENPYGGEGRGGSRKCGVFPYLGSF